LFIRREVLDRIGGFPSKAGYWMYAEALSCEARRQGYKLRQVGIACDHLGGKTSGMANVQDDWMEAHKWLYETYRDVLPYAVEG
jgi:GT2 family glycosyltransferase